MVKFVVDIVVKKRKSVCVINIGSGEKRNKFSDSLLSFISRIDIDKIRSGNISKRERDVLEKQKFLFSNLLCIKDCKELVNMQQELKGLRENYNFLVFNHCKEKVRSCEETACFSLLNEIIRGTKKSLLCVFYVSSLSWKSNSVFSYLLNYGIEPIYFDIIFSLSFFDMYIKAPEIVKLHFYKNRQGPIFEAGLKFNRRHCSLS